MFDDLSVLLLIAEKYLRVKHGTYLDSVSAIVNWLHCFSAVAKQRHHGGKEWQKCTAEDWCAQQRTGAHRYRAANSVEDWNNRECCTTCAHIQSGIPSDSFPAMNSPRPCFYHLPIRLSNYETMVGGTDEGRRLWCSLISMLGSPSKRKRLQDMGSLGAHSICKPHYPR